MTYSIEVTDGVVIVELAGPFDGGPDGAQLYDDCRVHCARGRNRLVIDCGDLKRLTAQGLGHLAGLLALARNAGGELVLARLPDFAESLLMITGMETVFPASATVDDARQLVVATESRGSA